MKKIWQILTKRVTVIALLLAAQFTLLILSLYFISSHYYYYAFLLHAISIVIVLWLVNRKDNPQYKISWILVIFTIPLAGGILYLMFGKSRTSKTMGKKINELLEENRIHLPNNQKYIDELSRADLHAAKQAIYMLGCTHQPVWKHTQTHYLTPGEVKFEALIRELKKAKRFILLEYFIIQEGVMWNTILDILRQKLKEGVEIKLIFDDLGTINTLPTGYDKIMRQLGIEAYVFNQFKPTLNAFMNNRDHRKIAVIDGNVGFTGGINLADEYINEYEKHGYWKDASIMIQGEAVWNLTVMFLEMWQYITGIHPNFEKYRGDQVFYSDGYVLPYDDNPIDDDLVGEMAYMNVINSAHRYLYITTPYLILDHEMITALSLASHNGVDVRIITPHVPDKFYVHAVTRSYYQELIQEGIRIYEFTPGFIHSKTIVADDEQAIVGTTNFDFRSFYLHFECGIWMYRSRAVGQVRDDFISTLESCEEITLEACRQTKWYIRIFRAVLRLFAPLM